MASSNGHVVGVDLGTTNSALAYMEGDQPTLIKNIKGETTTPSVGSFTEETRVVGEEARREVGQYPTKIARNIKREMGDDDAVFTVNGNEHTPEKISGYILDKLKKEAKRRFGQAPQQAVITVPAYFDNKQREATKTAAQYADLEVIRLLNEPTAAALAYSLNAPDEEQTVLAYDMGGGTFDVSIIKLQDSNKIQGNEGEQTLDLEEVLATRGKPELGGSDFDKALADWAAEQLLDTYDVEDPRENPNQYQDLITEARKVKESLSARQSVRFNLPHLTSTDKDGTVHFTEELTREQFENIVEDRNLISDTVKPVQSALDEAGLSRDDIDEVILVGGMTRMPAIQETVKELLDIQPTWTVDPDEAVAAGAAIAADALSDADSAEEESTEVPAITAHDLGVLTRGKYFDTVVPAGEELPLEATEFYKPEKEHSAQVRIEVLQRKPDTTGDFTTISSFPLSDITPEVEREDGELPVIEITFNINLNEELKVTAEEETAGSETIELEIETVEREDNIDVVKEEIKKHSEDLPTTDD